jgi:UMP-CMP kinase
MAPPANPKDDAIANLPAPNRTKPLLSPSEATIIFVLGGPGSGKGTQCAKLVSDYGFKHLSAGDLLREEQDRAGSQFGDLIKQYIKDGLIVPMEVTIQLLENAITETIEKEGNRQFLIDGISFLPSCSSSPTFSPTNASPHPGFPRKMDQALKFEEAVCTSKFTLFFDCPEDVMETRLLNRGKTSGRSDDNAESIKKRFKTFIETSMPVVDYFEKEGRVVNISAVSPPDEVYEEVKKRFVERGVVGK